MSRDQLKLGQNVSSRVSFHDLSRKKGLPVPYLHCILISSAPPPIINVMVFHGTNSVVEKIENRATRTVML